MSDELFAVPEMKSPRMKWVEKHHIETRRTANWIEGMEDDDGEEIMPWYSSDDKWKHQHGGASEDDALAEWAERNGKHLWFEEGK